MGADALRISANTGSLFITAIGNNRGHAGPTLFTAFANIHKAVAGKRVVKHQLSPDSFFLYFIFIGVIFNVHIGHGLLSFGLLFELGCYIGLNIKETISMQ